MAGVNIATAYIQLVPTFTGAQAAISKAMREAGADKAGLSAGTAAGQGFSSSFGDHVKTAAKLATGLIAGFAGGSVITSGLKRLTTIQDATAALNVQFGDTAKTADFMNRILGVVKGTPFNLDQFATAGKNLVAFGVAADKVPTYLTSLGEAAAASGKGSAAVDMMADAFGSMATEGAVTRDGINSLEAQGVPAMKILANHFGVTTEEMSKLVTKGTVPAVEGMDALSDGIMNGTDGVAGATVKFGGSMAGLRETFTGAFGGMKAAVARFGAGMLKPWLDDMTHGMQGATSFLDNAGVTIGEKSQQLRDAVVPKLKDMWSGLSMDAASRSAMTGDEGAFVKFGAGIRAAFDKLLPFLHDVAGAIRTLITGDFDPSQWGHEITEDSPIVDALLTIREKIQDAVAFVRTVISGNFDPSQWGSAITEDSPIVASALTIREKLQDLRGFIQTLVTGEFNPANWSAGTTADSPIVAKTLAIRDKISGVVEWIKGAFSGLAGIIAGAYQSASGGDSAQFWASVEQAGSTTSDLVRGIYGIAQALPSLSDVLSVAGGLLGFVADHMDTIIKWLPLLIAGFVAYKVTQGAVNIVNLANIPIQAAMVASQFALASANRALAISQGGVYNGMIKQTLMNIKSAALWVWNTAALVAHEVATRAVAVATKAWTVIQWLFNAAMDANPIMLAVIAIAALVAGVIYAWNNFDWFKDAVIACWTWIQNAAQWAWDNVLKPVFDFIAGGVQALGTVFTFLWENVVKPAWDGMQLIISLWWNYWIMPIFELIKLGVSALGTVFTFLWENVIQPAWDGIQNIITFAWNNVIQPMFLVAKGYIEALGAVFTFLWNNVVQPAWDGIQNIITFAWNNIISPIFDGIKGGLGLLADAFSFLWNDVIVPVWDGIKSAISTVWDFIRDYVFAPFGEAVGAIGGWFETAASAVSTAWDKIKEYASVPIKWVIETVWNKGVREAWNAITGWIPGIGDSLHLDEIKLNFASGGVVPGYAPGRDIVNARLSPGEAVLVPELTRALLSNGVDILGANRAARAGGDGLQYFADGGFFDNLWPDNLTGPLSGSALAGPTVGDAAGAVSDAASFTAAFASDPLGTIMGMLGPDISNGLVAMASSPWAKAIAQMPGAAIKGLIDVISSQLSSNGGAYFPGGSVISGDLNLSQNPSDYGWNYPPTLADMSWGGMGLTIASGTQGLWTGLLDTLNPNIQDGITNIGGYDDRQNVNNPSAKSLHAYGLAVDVNAPQNPNGVTAYGRVGPGVIPSSLAPASARQYGMIWGGDFTGTPDGMHFEIHVSPGQIGPGGGLGGTGNPGQWGTTAGMDTLNPVQDFGAMNMARGTAAQVGPIPPGGALERWRPMYVDALGYVGAPGGLIDSMMEQMRRESSGDPLSYAIDNNYRQGHPSKSLLQVIPGTFARNAAPGFGTNIWDPWSNALASLRYINAAGGGDYPSSHGPYDNGGWLQPGLNLNLRRQPEPVLTPQQWDVAERAINQASSGAGRSVVMNVYQLPGQSPADLARELDRRIAMQGAW